MAHQFHLYNALEEIVPARLDIAATAAGAQLFDLLEYTAIFGKEVLVDLYLVDKAIAGLPFVVLVKCFVEIRVGAGAGCRIVQVCIERFLYIGRKYAFAHEGYHHVAELGFPLLAMRTMIVPEVHKGEHMCQLVHEGDEEAVRIEVAVHTYAVMRLVGRRMPVIAEHRLALVREGKVHGVVLKIGRHQLEGVRWQKIFKVAERCFLLHFLIT